MDAVNNVLSTGDVLGVLNQVTQTRLPAFFLNGKKKLEKVGCDIISFLGESQANFLFNDLGPIGVRELFKALELTASGFFL